MTICRTIEFNDLTPTEMAELFLSWRARDQAEFFEDLCYKANRYSSAGWQNECEGIVCSLSRSGIDAVNTLANALAEYTEESSS